VVFNKLAFVLSAAGLFLAALNAECPALAKGKAHSSHGSYLVPPPPPYQPSILPEYAMSRTSYAAQSQIASATKPVQPYSKYIYTRNVADAPTAVQSNKYVTVWNHD